MSAARIPRRERTRSPHNRRGDDGGGGMDDESIRVDDISAYGAQQRRTSLANFSASKLVDTLKESNAPSITRLRRQNSHNAGMDVGTSLSITRLRRQNSHNADMDGGTSLSSGGGATSVASRGRRPPGRTLSAQAPRTSRLRSDNDALSQSLMENHGRAEELDASCVSNSTGGRRMLPPRTRSAQEPCLPRGHPAASAQRMPRARRRPGAADRDDSAEDNLDNSITRRRLPGRSKSAQDAFPAGYQRPARPGRRRHESSAADDIDYDDEEESVVISDSDEEYDRQQPIDRSNNSGHGASRRRAPQRTRSAQDSCLPRGHGGYQRAQRAARRRHSNDSDHGDDASAASGPGIKRSVTATPPPPSGAGAAPGLVRSNTTTNPRSARSRIGRDTARELAMVTNNREISPDPGRLSPTSIEHDRAAVNAKHSVSPIKSRSERRRLREDKEREIMERRLQVKMEKESKAKVEKKEEPWMRRRKNKPGGLSNDDSINFDDATAGRQDALSYDDSGGKGSSLPSLGRKDFFPTDPSFGVFPAGADIANTPDDDDDDSDDGQDAHLSAGIKGGKSKLDFSTIS